MMLTPISPNGCMAIGIDETKYIKRYDGSFSDKIGKSKCYALWSDEDRNK